MSLDALAQQLATGLARVAVALHIDNGQGAGLERTLAQQQILLLLTRRQRVYPLTELSADLGMTSQATLAAIGTLTREGLVAVGPAPSYAPQDVVVTLTEQGREHAPAMMHWAADLIAELSNLDESNQHRLLTLVTKQIRLLQTQDRIPVTRMCVTCRFFEGYAHPGTAEPHHCWLVDSPFGHQQLRLRCPEQRPASTPADEA